MEIDALAEMKPNVRRTSFFGDNHHAAIDRQIEILKDPPEYIYDIDRRADKEGWADNERDAAIGGVGMGCWRYGGQAIGGVEGPNGGVMDPQLYNLIDTAMWMLFLVLIAYLWRN